jgi:hypothetical protein
MLHHKVNDSFRMGSGKKRKKHFEDYVRHLHFSSLLFFSAYPQKSEFTHDALER